MPATIDFSKLDLMDALDLAILVEVEAYERYKLFSGQLGHRFPVDAGSIFQFMAENEAKHGKQLNDRRQEMFGDKPLRVSRSDIFDVEAPDYGATRWNMSPLQALQLALESEEKAYWFYDSALKHVSDPEVKFLFTELRSEETEHIRLVKKTIAELPPGSDIELENEDE